MWGTDETVVPWRTDPLAFVRAMSNQAGHGIYVGLQGNEVVCSAPEEAVLVLGPPRSGKTSSIVIPNVLAATGPVVVASTKQDVLDATADVRLRLGAVGVFDPSGEITPPEGVELVGWSPLRGSRTFDGAVHIVESMVEVARGGERGEESHWNERAGALLAPLFHAGALDGLKMREIVAWVDRRDARPAQAILGRADVDRACNVLKGITETDPRELSGIWSTASSVLSAYRTEAALVSSERPPIDAEKFVNGGRYNHTLYICASGRQQRHAAPLVLGLLREIRDAAYRGAASEGQDKPSPVLAVLDEMANIAPLKDLPSLVSEGGSQGMLVLGCLQDLSQARARWGQEADGFFSLFGGKVIFPGIGDVRTLEAVSKLCGEHQVPTRSTTAGSALAFLIGRGRPATTTTSTRTERRLPVDAIAAGQAGMAFVLDGKARAGFVQLTPYHLTSPWREIGPHQAWRRAQIQAQAREGGRVIGRDPHGRDRSAEQGGPDLGR
jgi:type IV secretion system protein VirD4